MKKQRRGPRPVVGAAIATALAVAGTALAQDLAEETRQHWYRVELLVFLREDTESLGAERWDPLPEPTYPDDARFLIDPGLADRRLEESAAYASTIDATGVQHLLLPGAFSQLDTTERPDSVIREPYEAPAPDVIEGEGGDGVVLESTTGDDDEGGQEAAGDTRAAELAALGDLEEAVPRIALAAPFQLVADDTLEFRSEARSLRRRGHRVAFHAAWWMNLPPDESVPALFLDRGGDPDDSAWPDLQGSVRIDRSRYLHIDVDLWLNTLAEYMPEGWQIDAPPLPPASIDGRTLTGARRNPWAREPELPVIRPGPDRAPAADLTQQPEAILADEAATALPEAGAEAIGNDGEMAATEEELAPPYPWRHAIVHRQSRRMRSGEVHYLDHPVIGVVVKLLPADEDLMPVSGEADIAFRERHGLPVEYVEASDEDSDEDRDLEGA